MAIGVMLSGIFSGLGGVIWMLLAGHSVLLALVCYPVLGILGAVGFVVLASLRHMARIDAGDDLTQLEPVTQG